MNYYTEYWDCRNEDRNFEVITCINKILNLIFSIKKDNI